MSDSIIKIYHMAHKKFFYPFLVSFYPVKVQNVSAQARFVLVLSTKVAVLG